MTLKYRNNQVVISANKALQPNKINQINCYFSIICLALPRTIAIVNGLTLPSLVMTNASSANKIEHRIGYFIIGEEQSTTIDFAASLTASTGDVQLYTFIAVLANPYNCPATGMC